MKINYDGKIFRAVSNSPNGQVSDQTIFHYTQQENILSAAYSGGEIKTGSMLGKVHDDNSIEFVYHHMDIRGTLKTGYCQSSPEMMDNNKIRLHEKWHWTFGGEGRGESVIEEQ